jgi:type 1 glutamine amidotransferase
MRRPAHAFSPALALIVALAPGAARAQERSELEPGATLRIYDLGRATDRVYPLGPDQTPNHDRRIDTIDFPDDAAFWAGSPGPMDYFAVEVLGYLHITEPGRYTFELTSDDGSILSIDGKQVVNNDGWHAPTAVRGSVELDAGLHPFRIDHFEASGGAALSLAWRTPGSRDFTLVPTEALRIEKGLTRVTSPGTKTVLDGKEHLRPGDGLPLDSVHPMWTVETVRPEGVQHRIGAMDFLPDGALVYSEFIPVNNGILRENTNGTIWKLEGVDGDRGRADAMPIKIAEGFHDPSGIVCIGTDIWVSHRPGLVRLRDTDGDRAYETREEFPVWVGNNYHHFSFGLQHHEDDAGSWIYGTLSTSIYFNSTLDGDPVEGEIISMNGPNPPHRGSAYRFNTDTHEVQWLGGGLRTPNGVHVDSRGRVLVADNQGAWHPANRLNHIKYEINDDGTIDGRFFGHYNGLQTSRLFPEGGTRADFMEGGEYPPAVWLPQNDVSNSPTTPLEILDGPFAGQYWLGELTAGGIRRVFLEEVNGELQGAVFRHSQGLESGVNRLIRGEDGCLYMGGTGADGNWNWRGTQYGLQRLRPTGDTAFEYHAVQAMPDGFLVRYTEPVSKAWLANPENFTVRSWRYFATPDYGGPMLDQRTHTVTRAEPSRSGDAVRLYIDGLEPGRVVHLRSDPTSTSGHAMWSTEAWYTLNQIPGEPEVVGLEAAGFGPFAATLRGKSVLVFSRTAGFRHGSIPDGIACLRELGEQHGFTTGHTEDAAAFNAEQLSVYDAVVFLNTTGDVLNDEQQAAFEDWYRDGGAFLGIHSAADTEYDWPWYGQLVGAYFRSHPRIQPARLIIAQHDHPAIAHLGGFPHFETWTRTDEWYDFRAQPAGSTTTLLRLDGATYNGGRIGDDASMRRTHPICWSHEFDGGRAIYTGGGHTNESYREPDFRRHLLGCLAWALGAE